MYDSYVSRDPGACHKTKIYPFFNDLTAYFFLKSTKYGDNIHHQLSWIVIVRNEH